MRGVCPLLQPLLHIQLLLSVHCHTLDIQPTLKYTHHTHAPTYLIHNLLPTSASTSAWRQSQQCHSETQSFAHSTAHARLWTSSAPPLYQLKSCYSDRNYKAHTHLSLSLSLSLSTIPSTDLRRKMLWFALPALAAALSLAGPLLFTATTS